MTNTWKMIVETNSDPFGISQLTQLRDETASANGLITFPGAYQLLVERNCHNCE